MLYVVIEGWREAKLSDSTIDQLLKSSNVKLLKRFRNAVFHFQGDKWISAKRSDFMGSPDAIIWADTLMKELQKYFLGEMRRINSLKTAHP